MPFFNRFLFFMVGIIIGFILIFFSLQYRKDKISFNYFPNSRVKNHFIKNDIMFSAKSLCKMNCFGLDTIMLNEYILHGNIDFKKSKIQGYTNKLYYLSFIDTTINIIEDSYLIFGVKSDSVELVDVVVNFDIKFNQFSEDSIKSLCHHCD